MRILMRGLFAMGLLATGYVLGASGTLQPVTIQAQDVEEPSEETAEKIKAAHEALSAAMQALQAENLYRPAISGVNSFAVTVGGVNAIQDLETGRGVDPVTFAGLYSDLATDEVAPHLSKDAEGRLTYKNKVVRMYPISRLKQLFAERMKILGLEPTIDLE